jgi:hypothetical protein
MDSPVEFKERMRKNSSTFERKFSSFFILKFLRGEVKVQNASLRFCRQDNKIRKVEQFDNGSFDENMMNAWHGSFSLNRK